MSSLSFFKKVNLRLSEKDFLWVCQTILERLERGLTVRESLQMMSHIAPRRIQSVLDSMIKRLLQGDTFLSVITSYSPKGFPYDVSLLSEDHSVLVVLQLMKGYYQDKYNRYQELVREIRYPMVLLIAMVGLGILLISLILPQQELLMSQVGAPNTDTMMEVPWFLIIGGICLIGCVGYWWINKRVDSVQVGVLLMSLGGLLNLGLSWKAALLILMRSQTKEAPLSRFVSCFFESPRFSYYWSKCFGVSPMTLSALSYVETAPNQGQWLYDLGLGILSSRHQLMLRGIRLIQPMVLGMVAVMVVYVMKVLILPMMSMVSLLDRY